jgi:hypothetical protein
VARHRIETPPAFRVLCSKSALARSDAPIGPALCLPTQVALLHEPLPARLEKPPVLQGTGATVGFNRSWRALPREVS